MAVWTIGEIITASVGLALVADLAPAPLRGRYNGVFGLAWSIASLLATRLLAVDSALLWVVCAALCAASTTGLLALGGSIRRRSPEVALAANVLAKE